MKSMHLWRAALSAVALSFAFLPAHAQSGGGAPAPTYSAAVFIDFGAAASDAVSEPYGRIVVPVYSTTSVPGDPSSRRIGLQWLESSSRPLTVVDNGFDGPPGFSMVTADGDHLRFSGLSFDLMTGAVTGSIQINGQLAMTDLIWLGKDQPSASPLDPLKKAPLVFSDRAREAVSSFVAGIAAPAVRTQYQLALLDGPLGTISTTQFASTIPEPASMALMALGLVGICAAAGKRRQR